MAEKRGLKMHPKLLMDVIKRQAGSLHKAVLEGVMNGIEAKATSVDVGFKTKDGKHYLVIKDDGNGITSKGAIEKFFETFGTPHDESEGKVWAQFRMGRGQLFAFGKNVWRTGTFRMTIDIEKNGLEYDLESNLPLYNGCHIEVELYKNPIGSEYGSLYASVEAFKLEVSQQCEFMDVPVRFNGDVINKSPKNCKWTYEDDDAYYYFGKGSDLAVYNLGAFTMKVPQHHAGVTGIIVSKKQLKVNFARNDIQSDCSVYTRIKRVVAKNRRDKAERTKLTRADRIALLQDLRDGELKWEDAKKLALIETAVGRAMKLTDILKSRVPWSFSKTDNVKADKLMQQGHALVFDRVVLESLRYSGKESDFFVWLMTNSLPAERYDYERIGPKVRSWSRLYQPFDDLSAKLNESYVRLSPDKLTAKERMILKTLEGYNCWGGRLLCVGISGTALAWTDGATYIAMDREFLDECVRSGEWGGGFATLINTLVHEMAHDSNSAGTHVHGEEFYQRFHDICVREKNPPQRVLGDFYRKFAQLKDEARKENKVARTQRSIERRGELLAASEG